jgi:hypothetical protein
MKTLNIKRALALALLGCAVFAGGARAAAISIVPSTFTVSVGDAVEFDVVVSGLGAQEAVGAVSIHLTGDSAILDAVGFSLDPDDKMGVEVDFGSGFGPDSLDLVFAAEDFGADQFTTLKALQGSGFTLAHVSLSALAPGISPIHFDDIYGGFLSNADGLTLVPAKANDGLVCVGEEFAQRCAPSVPEPALMSLFGAGFAAFVARRRRARTE